MHGETPEFKRCCFCLPLRRGLLAWGYAKLILCFIVTFTAYDPHNPYPNINYVLNLMTTAYMVAVILWSIRRVRYIHESDIAIFTVIMASLLVDLCFDVIFIVASHKKIIKLLNVSYIYNIVWLSLVLLGNGFQMYTYLYYMPGMWKYEEYRKYLVMDCLFSAGLAFSVIFVQIYLILLIRSEMTKLRKQSLEMQFSNHLASGEPQCTLHNACLTDQSAAEKQVVQDCTGEKQAVQDCCTREKQICCTKEISPA